jgi:hypothetical protein
MGQARDAAGDAVTRRGGPSPMTRRSSSCAHKDVRRPIAVTSRRRSLILACLLAPLAATQLGNGCVSDGGGSYGGGGSDGGGSAGAVQDRRFDADYVPRRLPRSAERVREGYEKIRWTADMAGTVYVYDVDNDLVAWGGNIKRGQEVVVDPKRDGVRIDETNVFQENLYERALHRIYFAPHPDRARGDRDADRDDGDGTSAGRGERAPRGATELARGRGDLVIGQTPGDGTVYVYDADAGRVVHAQPVGRGNSFQIFPADDYVNRNSKRAASVRLDADHRHILYFVSDGK